jgi:hypothetical protein
MATMSVQTKSLISSQPAEKKATTKPVKGTETIGESKTLAASALRRRASGAVNFRNMKRKA